MKKYIILFIPLIAILVLFLFTGLTSFIWGVYLYLIIALLVNYKPVKIIFISLALLEILLFFVSPYKSYGERNGDIVYQTPYSKATIPNKKKPFSKRTKSNSEFTITHQYNNYGFRDSDFAEKKYTALILGDSFVEGKGTNGNNTIDRNLEKLMKCDDCILNLGIIGNDLINEFTLVEIFLKNEIAIDLLILNLNNSDIFDIMYHSEYYNLSISSPNLPFQFIYGSNFLSRHIVHDFLKLDFSLNSNEEQNLNKIISSGIITNYIQNYNLYCKQKNINFIVVFQPTLWEIENDTFELQNVINALKDTEINYINANHFLEEKTNPEDYYWPIDLHFNDKGYAYYSNFIYCELNSKKLLKN